jgi:hypothetical protein
VAPADAHSSQVLRFSRQVSPNGAAWEITKDFASKSEAFSEDEQKNLSYGKFGVRFTLFCSVVLPMPQTPGSLIGFLFGTWN